MITITMKQGPAPATSPVNVAAHLAAGYPSEGTSLVGYDLFTGNGINLQAGQSVTVDETSLAKATLGDILKAFASGKLVANAPAQALVQTQFNTYK